jgi:hypothetical protein
MKRFPTRRMRSRLFIVVGIAAVLRFAAGAAQAGTITVTGGEDGIGVCPGPACTLRQAIATATPGDTIDFAQGITAINLTSGELFIDKNLTIDGPGADLLTVRRNFQADTDPKFRIFNIASGNVIMSGLTISNGTLVQGFSQVSGAGILNQASATLALTECIVSSNHAGGAEGNARGGGIYNAGTLNLDLSSVSGNTGLSDFQGDGGGIYNTGTVQVTTSNISDNFGTTGGGIYNFSGTVSIINSTFSGNKASRDAYYKGEGGAIYNSGVLTVIDSTFSGNNLGSYSGLHGGGSGAAIFSDGAITITDSTFHSHVVEAGGIVTNLGRWYHQHEPPPNAGTLHITNSTISGNSAIYSTSPGILNSGRAHLLNCTIAGNSARGGYGTGLFNGTEGITYVRNTIIAGNTARSASSGPDIYGAVTSQGYNLIGISDGGTITPMSGDQIGTAGAPIDPLLGPLQDNGGPTLTRLLLSGSPAIDRGGAADGVTTDQRDLPRPVDDPDWPNAIGGDGSDIGAVELTLEESVPGPSPTPSPTPTAAATPTPTPTPTPPARSLEISTRGRVLTGNHVMIGGFIITGNAPKRVIVRAIGPSLEKFGLEVLSDPVLELRGPDGSLIASCDNWKENPEQALQIQASGVPPQHHLESAIVANLPPAGYTAIMSGKSNGTGLGLVEIYDLDQNGSDSELANISTRALVGNGDNVVIGGFILGGSEGSPKIIVRALGPSLSRLGIFDPLADPTLELRDGNGALMVVNDNWDDDPAQAEQIEAAGVAPRNDLEAAIAATLPPGLYTAVVAGKGGSTGTGLVEVYNLKN